MENNDNNDQDPLNSDPIEEETTKNEKPPPKTHVVSSSRRTLANITHYSDLRHFQRLVNEYQKNPEALPRWIRLIIYYEKRVVNSLNQ